MPWEHCGAEVLDDGRCPGCGISKAQWTLEWNVTRTFTVARKGSQTFLRIVASAPGDRPLAGEPFRVEQPDGQVAEGRLDEYGTAKIPTVEGGAATLHFPSRAPGELALLPDEGRLPAQVDPSRAAFRCLPHERPYQLRVRAGELRLRLRIDPGDAETMDDRFVLRSADDPPSYLVTRTIRDDTRPGDRCLDLHYEGLDTGLSYTLEIYRSAHDEQPERLFECIPFAQLGARARKEA